MMNNHKNQIIKTQKIIKRFKKIEKMNIIK